MKPKPCTLPRRKQLQQRLLQRLAKSQTATLAREFFIGNLLVRIHFIIVMIRWTSLAPWESDFAFPGSLASIFLPQPHTLSPTPWPTIYIDIYIYIYI